MASIGTKSLNTPDETRTPDKTRMDLVNLGGAKADA